MEKTLISIITPTYNRDYCIQRAINSVKNLLIPDNFDYEHIIIDDGSTDNTKKIIENKKYKKLKYLKLDKNQGVNAARKHGINKAKGEYVLFFDSDDELVKKALIIIQQALLKTQNKFKLYKFQTRNHNTKENMTYIKYPYKNVSYKDRLEGKILSGEFMPLIHKSVFKKIQIDEKNFCFESFFWNKISKEFNSEVGINKTIRIYHDENEDRVSKKLQDKKFVLKRFNDYKLYLKTFKKDYKEFNLKKDLSMIYFKCGFYGILSNKNKRRMRDYFTKAWSIKPSILFIIAYMLSFLGKLPFLFLLNLIQKKS